jgi:hypothetical protein
MAGILGLMVTRYVATVAAFGVMVRGPIRHTLRQNLNFFCVGGSLRLWHARCWPWLI